MIQLIAVAVIVLALGGAWYAHNLSEQKIGAAKVEAEYQRQQAEAAKENERIAMEGKAAALRLLAAAEQRNRAQAAKLRSDAVMRGIESDARAKEDREYSLWRESAVPVFAANRLRHAIELTATDADSNRLPGNVGLSPATPVPAAAGSADESWIRKLRARLSGSGPSGVAGR